MKTMLFIILMVLMLGLFVASFLVNNLLNSHLLLCLSIVSALIIFKLVGFNKLRS